MRSKFIGFTICLGIVVAGILILFIIFGRGLAVKEQTAIKAMNDQGFKNVQVIDHSWFFIGWRGGSDDDVARFTVKATNPAGEEVTMHVFSGWPFKGATVRSID